jgi:(p)ppGpp synthase/HD superfamily hydrolase
MKTLTKAILFATRAHDGQVRKGSGLPFISHPLDGMAILILHGITDETTLAAMVTHDVPEDTKFTIDDLAREVWPQVADIVSHLTKPANLSKHEQRKWAIEALQRGPSAARIIKMADRLSNLSDMESAPWSHAAKRAYATEALHIAEIGRDDCASLSRELSTMANHLLSEVLANA